MNESRKGQIVVGPSVPAFVISVSLLVLHFTWQLPTSDYRARIYMLLYAAPVAVGGSYFIALALLSSALLFATGWRGWRAMCHIVLGALLAMLPLYFGWFSWVAWRHDEDITPMGRFSRTAGALAALAGTLLIAKRTQQRQTETMQVSQAAT